MWSMFCFGTETGHIFGLCYICVHVRFELLTVVLINPTHCTGIEVQGFLGVYGLHLQGSPRTYYWTSCKYAPPTIRFMYTKLHCLISQKISAFMYAFMLQECLGMKSLRPAVRQDDTFPSVVMTVKIYRQLRALAYFPLHGARFSHITALSVSVYYPL
jgi:hypothetical protein